MAGLPSSSPLASPAAYAQPTGILGPYEHHTGKVCFYFTSTCQCSIFWSVFVVAHCGYYHCHLVLIVIIADVVIMFVIIFLVQRIILLCYYSVTLELNHIFWDLIPSRQFLAVAPCMFHCLLVSSLINSSPQGGIEVSSIFPSQDQSHKPQMEMRQ
uniref:Uncharacterized protein n=1 Tax=Rhizophora mucronata TaxID=61149 RepID=A0A2P2JXA9_RHIMU